MQGNIPLQDMKTFRATFKYDTVEHLKLLEPMLAYRAQKWCCLQTYPIFYEKWVTNSRVYYIPIISLRTISHDTHASSTVFLTVDLADYIFSNIKYTNMTQDNFTEEDILSASLRLHELLTAVRQSLKNNPEVYPFNQVSRILDFFRSVKKPRKTRT